MISNLTTTNYEVIKTKRLNKEGLTIKKMLLGSTALATASFIAAPVAASELSIRISGYMNGGFYVVGADDTITNTPASDADFDLRSNASMASLNVLNALHPHNQGNQTPDNLILAATCSDGTTLTISDLQCADGMGPEHDGMTAATDDAAVYFTQTKAATVASSSTDEYSQAQLKLGGGRIVIDTDGVLENGMKVGGRVRIEAFGDKDADDIIDEHYFYVSGGYGRIIMGAKNGAADQMHYTSPWFIPGNGVDDPNFYNISRTSVRTYTSADMSGDAIKLTYFTPRVSGIQLGASYTPNNRDRDGLGNGDGLATDGVNTKGIEDIIDFGVNYVVESAGGSELALSAGWETGTTNVAGAEDPVNWSVGGSLEWERLTFGGAYYYGENLDKRETTVWTAGVAWADGPWSGGVAYLEATAKGGSGGLGDEENSFLQVGGGYTIGRGVDIGLDVQFIEDDNGGNTNQTRVLESTSAGIVMNVDF